MAAAYDSATWQLFFATIAGATAALIGLLFVALSLHLAQIMADPAARGRAREALGLFLALLALTILALIPGQGRRWLGAELLGVGLALAIISVRLQGETRRRLAPSQRPGHLRHIAPINLGTLGILIAGASLLVGRGGGFYWLAPTVFLFLGVALFNAWMLTVRMGAG